MKFRQTRFARQMMAVVVGLLLVVATVAFVTIPANLAAVPGEPAIAWHPT
ncbi:MAG: hypothetical protein KDH20_01035 [Rhodocyclaceae bacterium]|nr:hypothetical protein [Rhodocyclaceae bacterium]